MEAVRILERKERIDWDYEEEEADVLYLSIPRAPEPSLVGGRRRVGHPADGGLALLPDAIETRERRLRVLDALDEAEGPQLEEGRPARQGLAHLPEQVNLRRAEREKAPPLAPEDHQAPAVIQPADGSAVRRSPPEEFSGDARFRGIFGAQGT